MKHELTEPEMLELAWQKSEGLYFKEEDGAIVCAEALPNGNAPVGGQHYETIEPSSEAGQ